MSEAIPDGAGPMTTALEGSDEGWIVRFEVTAANRRSVEALATIANGRFGTRGLLDHRGDLIPGSTLAAGVYDGDDVPGLLPGPRWSVVDLSSGRSWSETVALNLATGVLRVELVDVGPGEDGANVVGQRTVVATLLASIVDAGLHMLQVTGPVEVVHSGPPLRAPDPRPGVRVQPFDVGGGSMSLTVGSERGSISATATQVVRDVGRQRTITRFARFESCVDGGASGLSTGSGRSVADVERAGFARLRREHEHRWRQRWETCAIDMPARPDLELAIRLAQYHLLAAGGNDDEVAIGARGLTGPAYRGHVFWDTDVFVLPALSAMAPDLAHGALLYRINRLPAAMNEAAEQGLTGACYPWESALSGAEVAPTEGRDLHGKSVPILTGTEEQHIVADVAWSIMNHLRWTGADELLAAGGADVLIETARYWQSRTAFDDGGVGHIRGVIGPDEYHETVDDNAFTNGMARWNLRTAAAVAAELGTIEDEERRSWLRTAENLVDGYSPSEGIHEQFAGYFRLEPVLTAAVGEPPLPADVLIGHDRIQQTQIIKQADVLMLHHLLPDTLPAGSLECDLDHYLPRTAHGSSLSPAITASVLARAGRSQQAVRWFELAARFDLDDVSGTTAGGVHLATMGGFWQALANGFFGLRPAGDALAVDPRLPDEFGVVTLRINWRSVPVRLEASAEQLIIEAQEEIDVAVAGVGTTRGRDVRALRRDERWELT